MNDKWKYNFYPQERIHSLEKILDFICQHKRQHDGNSPSVQEIMDSCGIPSKGVAYYALKSLERDGRIRLPQARGSARGIEVVGGRWEIQR